MSAETRGPNGGSRPALRNLLKTGQDWLIKRVLAYAKEHDYTKYTSTLEEAWRISIEGLSEALCAALDAHENAPELDPDEDFSNDPCTAFGILEAQRHRARGVDLSMFLGLMKYYRQSYVDLVREAGLDKDEEEWCRLFVRRFFDRVEIALSAEWASRTETELSDELRSSNRVLMNEKNKYVTIFESLFAPVILVGLDGRVDNLNHAAQQLFLGAAKPGAVYYDEAKKRPEFPQLADELARFSEKQDEQQVFEKELDTTVGTRQYEVKFRRMLDVSGKFVGITVMLNDITERKRAQEERERLIGKLEKALAEVRTLSGLLPICAACKNIRDDHGYWKQIETYVTEHSQAVFSHGLCPDCAKKLYPEVYERRR